MTELALQLDGVTKTYKGFALRDVSFELPRGYVMGLIGANGAGKTTIIKLIVSAVRRDGGTIRLFGSDNLLDGKTLLTRVGFVQDEPTFYGHLTLAGMKSIVAAFYPSWDEQAFGRLAERSGLRLSQRVMTLCTYRQPLGYFGVSIAAAASLHRSRSATSPSSPPPSQSPSAASTAATSSAFSETANLAEKGAGANLRQRPFGCFALLIPDPNGTVERYAVSIGGR